MEGTYKKLLTKAAIKQDDGTLSSYIPIGASFEEVYDTRKGAANSGAYSLAQFFDNYLEFMNNVKLVHTGDTAPTNPKFCLWIDTSKTNQN